MDELSFPDLISTMEQLDELERLGLVMAVPTTDGKLRYALTPDGEAAIAAPRRLEVVR